LFNGSSRETLTRQKERAAQDMVESIRYTRCAIPQVINLASGLSCRIETRRLGRLRKFKAAVASVNSDGGEMLAPEPISPGQTLQFVLDDFAEETFQVVSVACQAEGLDSYRVRIRLQTGAWPYQIYSRIAAVAGTQASTLSTPNCLREFGLASGCTLDDLEDAFAKVVRRCHPDRGGSVDDFVRIRRAYLDSLAYLGARR
jgi:hypothetical protein